MASICGNLRKFLRETIYAPYPYHMIRWWRWIGIALGVVALAIFFARGSASLKMRAGTSTASENTNAKKISLAAVGEFPRVKGALPKLPLSAEGAIAVYVREGVPLKVLFEKNSETPRPIASITKLLTALAVEKVFPEGTPIPISPLAEKEPILDTQSKLYTGEIFSREDMLKLLLIESSNAAGQSFADAGGGESFLARMREEANQLRLTSARIVNATGLDPLKGVPNELSPSDVARLFGEILAHHPLLRSIVMSAEAEVRNSAGISYNVYTTNALLGFSSQTFTGEVFAGKTGETPQAHQAFVFAAKSPNSEGYIIGVILKSEDRFGEAKNLLEWVYAAYDWMG